MVLNLSPKIGASLNTLFKFDEPGIQKLIPLALIKKIRARMNYVDEGVRRVEKAAGVSYPPHYIEPFLTIASSELERGQIGIMYARTLPIEVQGSIEIWIQISATLVALGSKSTIHSILAHEFLHYIDLVKRFTNRDLISQNLTSTMFEGGYVDVQELFPMESIFYNGPLIRLVKKKFGNMGLLDEKLNGRAVKMWIEKGLPVLRLTPDSNVAKVSVSSILNARFDPLVKMKIDELERQNK